MHKDDVTIRAPKDGAEVPRCVSSIHGTGKVKDHHVMWIALEYLDKQGHTRIHFARRADMRDGTWTANKVNVGGAGQKLSPYTLTVVEVDEATDAALGSTLVSTARSHKAQVSYDAYPSGAHPVAHVNVTRARGDDPSCDDDVQKARANTKH
ncbi:hypothetical protein PO587_38720 [Streptomyces gilvifuscus]|uniref:Uncharacterized protein n=1 Tax=Streptomyces gilvifuscus TaxID=1550617 RepID=A0ABT5G6S2_9ACTN|nr:hypothetical protein [Streptomyces gilvifuscus]MDC2960376.1 hypothetical protein [Streptomyces gilvifuscus]